MTPKERENNIIGLLVDTFTPNGAADVYSMFVRTNASTIKGMMRELLENGYTIDAEPDIFGTHAMRNKHNMAICYMIKR